MLPADLVQQLREMQELWVDSIVSNSMLEEFILEHLLVIDANQYELSSILSSDVINLLITHGEQQLKHEGCGGVRMIASGRVIDLSHLAVKYRKLFKRWEARRWIRVELDKTVIRL